MTETWQQVGILKKTREAIYREKRGSFAVEKDHRRLVEPTDEEMQEIQEVVKQ